MKVSLGKKIQKPQTKPKIELEPSPSDSTSLLREPAAEKPKSKIALSLQSNKALTEAAKETLDPIALDDIVFPKDFYEIENFSPKVFETNMFNLAEKLIADDRDIKGYLMDILRNLKQFPELTHLLSAKQMGMIVEGFKQYKQVEIKAKKPAKPTAIKQLEGVGSKSLLEDDAW